jgi:hypothetical protein
MNPLAEDATTRGGVYRSSRLPFLTKSAAVFLNQRVNFVGLPGAAAPRHEQLSLSLCGDLNQFL